jgi:hypothetical protein
VLEFGSGRSTSALGHACALLSPPATLDAIEHDPAYLDLTSSVIATEGLWSGVRVISAPIVVRRCHDRNVPVYLLRDGARGKPGLVRPDLILVDGPPLPLGGREGALYQALHASHAGTVVVLDDSRRESERGLLVRMLAVFGGHVEAMNLLGFPKGLAVVLVVGPIEPQGFPTELIGR